MAAFFPQAAPPQSALARYRLLSPKASVRVSPIQLGGMSIGDSWNAYFGSMDKEASFKLLDAYYDKGGNFIDTANFYQSGQSEQWIGEWAEKRGIRDRLFIATKYTNNSHFNDQHHKVLFAGNGTKSLQHSLKMSLENLRTDYIDLLYVHWWDWDTTVEEVMQSLHHLVAQGKVLYLGISDAPAWIVSKANQYARDHALTPFVVYQGAWSVMNRAFEREIIPMAREEGMALAPWNVLVSGKLRSDAEEQNREKTGDTGRGGDAWRRGEEEKKMSAALEKVAGEIGAKSVTSVAIAYVMQKTPYVFPIIGGRKVEHLEANLEALDISLSDEQIKYLESIVPFTAGFPYDIIGDGTVYNFLLLNSSNLGQKPVLQAIRPSPK